MWKYCSNPRRIREIFGCLLLQRLVLQAFIFYHFFIYRIRQFLPPFNYAQLCKRFHKAADFTITLLVVDVCIAAGGASIGSEIQVHYVERRKHFFTSFTPRECKSIEFILSTSSTVSEMQNHPREYRWSSCSISDLQILVQVRQKEKKNSKSSL